MHHSSGDPKSRTRSRRPTSARIRTLLPCLVLLALATGYACAVVWSPQDASRYRREATPRGELLADEQRVISLFQDATPSVVHITSIGLRRDFWSRNVYRVPEGSGSGFVWDGEGHIVTNFHVVQSGQSFQVVLQDGTKRSAELVGVAQHKDLAVLRLSSGSQDLRPITLGSSRELKVGQSVYAIGNPFGLDRSLTTGVISALGRQIESRTRTTIYNVIQSDAAVNPGNSGGPLLDSAGRLIGVNTAIYSPSGASAGISFSIPVDTVRRIVPDLIAYGRVRTPLLGFSAYEGPRERDLPGVLVMEVSPESPVFQAGLRGTTSDRLGDIIVAVDGRPTPDLDELRAVLQSYHPGDEVEVTVVRGERRASLRTRLMRSPED